MRNSIQLKVVSFYCINKAVYDKIYVDAKYDNMSLGDTLDKAAARSGVRQ